MALLCFTREQIQSQFKSALADKRGSNEICLTWIKQLGSFSWLDKKMCNDQMKLWRGLAKEGSMKIMKYNNKESEHDGKTVYHFVVQPYENGKMTDCQMCPYSLMMLGILVSGYTYSFHKKENRDAIYEYVMKGISQ